MELNETILLYSTRMQVEQKTKNPKNIEKKKRKEKRKNSKLNENIKYACKEKKNDQQKKKFFL